MILISELTPESIGSWVQYNPAYAIPERGKIKSWNAKHIFVVYKCENNWQAFQDYTACATKPEDLTRITVEN